MKDKVVVITGATSGIGQVAAENHAGKGARIIQVARDRERGEAALKRLRECAPGATHAIYYADLSRLSKMKRVASEIASAEPVHPKNLREADFGARSCWITQAIVGCAVTAKCTTWRRE